MAESFRNYKVRVQEPGNAYYIVFRECKIEVKGVWLILTSKSGVVEGIFTDKTTTYAVIPSKRDERD